MGDVYQELARVLACSRVRLSYESRTWFYNEEHLHLSQFACDVLSDPPMTMTEEASEKKRKRIGEAGGYVYRSMVEDRYDFLTQCDSLSQDSCTYAEYLAAEIVCYEKVFGYIGGVDRFDSILLIKDVSIDNGDVALYTEAVATLLAKEQTELVIIDPTAPDRDVRGLVESRLRMEALIDIGFWPMITTAEYMIGWNYRWSEQFRSFDDVLKAKKAGKFKRVLSGFRDRTDDTRFASELGARIAI